MRKRGLSEVSSFRRVAACFLMGLAIPIGLLLLFGLIHPVLLAIGAGGLALLFLSVHKTPRLPVWGWHLGVILLCNLLYLSAFNTVLDRANTLAKRCLDGANLNAIGKGLAMYSDRHGEFPDDLRRLVDAEIWSGNVLLPMNSEALIRPRPPASRPYAGPCEFTYIFLPDDAPEGLVWVWESPRFHDGEGAYVLYTGYAVRWVTPEKLEQDLQCTRAWLADHPTQTKPASMPASARAGPK